MVISSCIALIYDLRPILVVRNLSQMLKQNHYNSFIVLYLLVLVKLSQYSTVYSTSMLPCSGFHF